MRFDTIKKVAPLVLLSTALVAMLTFIVLLQTGHIPQPSDEVSEEEIKAKLYSGEEKLFVHDKWMAVISKAGESHGTTTFRTEVRVVKHYPKGGAPIDDGLAAAHEWIGKKGGKVIHVVPVMKEAGNNRLSPQHSHYLLVAEFPPSKGE